VVGVESGRRRK